jgi:hypothetical protein
MLRNIDPMNWMSQIPSLQNTQLWNICLPTSHDAGTYGLTTTLTTDLNPDEQNIVDFLNGVAEVLTNLTNKFPALGDYIPQPVTWVFETVISYLQGILRTTYNTVGQQLADGIRCLDLRIYQAPAGYFTYHTLVASPLAEVLSDLSNFLQTAAAEIVYVTLGHFRNVSPKSDLYNEVASAVGDYVYVPESGYGNNPFFQTYEQIVTQGSTSPRSRAIVVMADDDPPTPFWPVSYSPPDNGDVVSGLYSNTDDVTLMINDQNALFGSRSQGSPFALYQLLTPQSDPVKYGLGTLLYTALVQLARSIQLYDPSTASALVDLANFLPNTTPAYWSLQQLAQVADGNLNYTVDQVLNGFDGTNPLSFIYADFYEASNLVDIAIALSSGPGGAHPSRQ